MNERHTEFFGPDLGRGPFSSQRIETSALQIATALAQVRAPLGRSEDELRGHVDFIRELADRLAPDYATTTSLAVGAEVADTIQTTLRTGVAGYSLLECWLADSPGGERTTVSPTAVAFTTGVVLQTIEPGKHFRVITGTAGLVTVSVSYAGVKDWYWAVTRLGVVAYSPRLHFV